MISTDFHSLPNTETTETAQVPYRHPNHDAPAVVHGHIRSFNGFGDGTDPEIRSA